MGGYGVWVYDVCETDGVKCVPREGHKYVCCGDVIGHTCPLFIPRSMNGRMCVSVVKNSHICHGMDLHVTGTDLSCSCSGVYCMDKTRRDRHEGTKGSSPPPVLVPLHSCDAAPGGEVSTACRDVERIADTTTGKSWVTPTVCPRDNWKT